MIAEYKTLIDLIDAGSTLDELRTVIKSEIDQLLYAEHTKLIGVYGQKCPNCLTRIYTNEHTGCQPPSVDRKRNDLYISGEIGGGRI